MMKIIINNKNKEEKNKNNLMSDLEKRTLRPNHRVLFPERNQALKGLSRTSIK